MAVQKLALTLALLLTSGCGLLENFSLPTTRKVRVIVSSVEPPSPSIEWQFHTNTECPDSSFYTYTINKSDVGSFTSTFAFKETLGRTSAVIQNFSIAYGSTVDGIDLSKHNFSGGINLFIPSNGEASTNLQTFSASLLSDIGPLTNYGLNPVEATITFTGESGVGEGFTVGPIRYTFLQFLIREEDLQCPSTS